MDTAGKLVGAAWSVWLRLVLGCTDQSCHSIVTIGPRLSGNQQAHFTCTAHACQFFVYVVANHAISYSSCQSTVVHRAVSEGVCHVWGCQGGEGCFGVFTLSGI